MRADAHCCLNNAGSIHSPLCAVLSQREFMMGKRNSDPGKTIGYSCGGKSIKEMYEEELDAIIDRLMGGEGEAADGRDPGRAENASYFIAILINPYLPDIDAVKAAAMERYEERQ